MAVMIWALAGSMSWGQVADADGRGGPPALADTAAAEGDLGPSEAERALESALPGAWLATEGDVRLRLVLEEDGRFRLGAASGAWQVRGDELVLHHDEPPRTVIYVVVLDQQGLTLSSDDLSEPLRLARLAEDGEQLRPPPPETLEPADDEPAEEPAPDLIGRQQDRVAGETLVGAWISDTRPASVRLVLRSDGTFSLDHLHGRYEIEYNHLRLFSEDRVDEYEYELTPDALILRGGGLRRDTRFLRQADVLTYVSNLVDLSPSAIRGKLYRILIIAMIVVAARLIILALQGISYLLVVYDWGPLGWIWRRNKRRVQTLHSLVLNLVKYIVYFMAVGFVFSELGINYTAYIASLSVVGLAIGFGSQGLVQDMVTGFFVIFEGQFDVGDMVEISGQTGVVTDLGLRMTKMRNYFGQEVVIPNRNIAVVGNYRLGSQQAALDVAIASPEVAVRGAELLERIGEELYRQFSGIVLTRPEVEGPLRLATGEHFLRMRLSLWPNQNWVIDQQFIPRIRETFKREELEVPYDRVVAFYRPRELQSVNSWRQRLHELQERIGWQRRPHEGDKGDTEV